MDAKNIIDQEAENPILAGRQVLSDPSVIYSPEALRDIIRRLLSHIENDCGNAISKLSEQLSDKRDAMSNIATALSDSVGTGLYGDSGEADPDRVFAGIVSLCAERANLMSGLKFYAEKKHLVGFDSEVLGFDSVSGEPQNWLIPCIDPDEAEPKKINLALEELMVEDGGIARGVLEGNIVVYNGDGVVMPDGNLSVSESPPCHPLE